MSSSNAGADWLQAIWQGDRLDVLAIHPETAQRIHTAGLENGAEGAAVQRTLGHADPAPIQLYDRRRFMPTKLAGLTVEC